MASRGQPRHPLHACRATRALRGARLLHALCSWDSLHSATSPEELSLQATQASGCLVPSGGLAFTSRSSESRGRTIRKARAQRRPPTPPIVCVAAALVGLLPFFPRPPVTRKCP